MGAIDYNIELRYWGAVQIDHICRTPTGWKRREMNVTVAWARRPSLMRNCVKPTSAAARSGDWYDGSVQADQYHYRRRCQSLECLITRFRAPNCSCCEEARFTRNCLGRRWGQKLALYDNFADGSQRQGGIFMPSPGINATTSTGRLPGWRITPEGACYRT